MTRGRSISASGAPTAGLPFKPDLAGRGGPNSGTHFRLFGGQHFGEDDKALAQHPDGRLNIPIRATAQELPVLRPGSKDWSKAARAIENPTKTHGTDFRVGTYEEAEQLLRDAGLGELPYYEKNKTFGWDRYRRGYEVHPAEPQGAAPQNNLRHVKWKTELGDGHIYYGE